LVRPLPCAQAKADFISKAGITHKDARETRFWLRLIGDSGLLREPPASAPKGVLKATPKLAELKQEAAELVKILGSIVASARNNK